MVGALVVGWFCGLDCPATIPAHVSEINKRISEVFERMLRIVPSVQKALVRQLENNVDCGRRIDRLSVSLRGLELDLLRRAQSTFIKSVT